MARSKHRPFATEDTPLLSDDETLAPSQSDMENGYDSDPEFDGLSVYEKKSLLVDREINEQGMGRYQWCIFLLCGSGYFLDLLWAQAFGLLIPAIQPEFGFSDASLTDITVSFNVGLCVGAFVWGLLIDIIGRYWAFVLTVLWSSTFGMAMAAPNDFNAILVLVAFIGIGVGGNIPVDTTITLECLPSNRRWLLPALSVFQPIGVVVSSLICLAFVPKYSCITGIPSCNNVGNGQQCCSKDANMGWRYTTYTFGGISFAIFFARFALFRFQESPKYLLYKGQDEKAVQSLQYMAKFSNRQSTITIETFRSLSEGAPKSAVGPTEKSENKTMKQKTAAELQRFKLLFSTPTMVRITLLIWIIYAFDYWGFTITGSLLPTILQRKNASTGFSMADTYRSYVYIYLFGILGVILGTSIYSWRYMSMLISSVLFASCLFIFTTVRGPISYIGISGLVYFFQSMFNSILYGTTPEFFPAPIRGTASGVASFWGRLFAIISPLVAGKVLTHSYNGVLYLAGGGVFVCSIAILLLPRKAIGQGGLST